MTSTPVATRGDRLVLHRLSFDVPDWPEEQSHEMLEVVEVNAEGLAFMHIAFDVDDFDAAIAELDARYIAGEGAAHARTWSVIVKAYAALHLGELPAASQSYVNIDHRMLRETIDAATRESYVRVAKEVAPDFSVYIEAVHRLNDCGAVYTDVTHGTSQGGFDAEWRMIQLDTVEGGLLNHSERFDESDLDSALARFDELTRPTPRLENAATRVADRYASSFLPRLGGHGRADH